MPHPQDISRRSHTLFVRRSWGGAENNYVRQTVTWSYPTCGALAQSHSLNYTLTLYKCWVEAGVVKAAWGGLEANLQFTVS